nr:MAG TPA: hypothetical protein [Caudoviricetes sp.]
MFLLYIYFYRNKKYAFLYFLFIFLNKIINENKKA